jgi:hypothetical protein
MDSEGSETFGNPIDIEKRPGIQRLLFHAKEGFPQIPEIDEEELQSPIMSQAGSLPEEMSSPGSFVSTQPAFATQTASRHPAETKVSDESKHLFGSGFEKMSKHHLFTLSSLKSRQVAVLSEAPDLPKPVVDEPIQAFSDAPSHHSQEARLTKETTRLHSKASIPNLLPLQTLPLPGFNGAQQTGNSWGLLSDIQDHQALLPDNVSNDSEKENSQDHVERAKVVIPPKGSVVCTDRTTLLTQSTPRLSSPAPSKPSSHSFLIKSEDDRSPWEGFERIPRKHVQIPKDQRALLDRDDSWYNLGEEEGPMQLNVPPEVLIDLQAFHAAEPRNNTTETELQRNGAAKATIRLDNAESTCEADVPHSDDSDGWLKGPVASFRDAPLVIDSFPNSPDITLPQAKHNDADSASEGDSGSPPWLSGSEDEAFQNSEEEEIEIKQFQTSVVDRRNEGADLNLESDGDRSHLPSNSEKEVDQDLEDEVQDQLFSNSEGHLKSSPPPQIRSLDLVCSGTDGTFSRLLSPQPELPSQRNSNHEAIRLPEVVKCAGAFSEGTLDAFSVKPSTVPFSTQIVERSSPLSSSSPLAMDSAVPYAIDDYLTSSNDIITTTVRDGTHEEFPSTYEQQVSCLQVVRTPQMDLQLSLIPSIEEGVGIENRPSVIKTATTIRQIPDMVIPGTLESEDSNSRGLIMDPADINNDLYSRVSAMGQPVISHATFSSQCFTIPSSPSRKTGHEVFSQEEQLQQQLREENPSESPHKHIIISETKTDSISTFESSCYSHSKNNPSAVQPLSAEQHGSSSTKADILSLERHRLGQPMKLGFSQSVYEAVDIREMIKANRRSFMQQISPPSFLKIQERKVSGRSRVLNTSWSPKETELSNQTESSSTKDITPPNNKSLDGIPDAKAAATSELQIERRTYSTTDSSPDNSFGHSCDALGSKSTIFDKFRLLYPTYSASQGRFIRSCVYLEWLRIEAKAAPHPSLWDDFIRAFSTEYMEYVREYRLSKRKPTSGIDFYNDEIANPVFTKRVVTGANLQEALNLDPVETNRVRQKFLGSSPSLTGFPSFSASSRGSTPITGHATMNAIFQPYQQAQTGLESNEDDGRHQVTEFSTPGGMETHLTKRFFDTASQLDFMDHPPFVVDLEPELGSKYGGQVEVNTLDSQGSLSHENNVNLREAELTEVQPLQREKRNRGLPWSSSPHLSPQVTPISKDQSAGENSSAMLRAPITHSVSKNQKPQSFRTASISTTPRQNSPILGRKVPGAHFVTQSLNSPILGSSMLHHGTSGQNQDFATPSVPVPKMYARGTKSMPRSSLDSSLGMSNGLNARQEFETSMSVPAKRKGSTIPTSDSKRPAWKDFAKSFVPQRKRLSTKSATLMAESSDPSLDRGEQGSRKEPTLADEPETQDYYDIVI